MNIELVVKHGDIAIKIVGKKAGAIVSQYKDLLWELGYPVQGGKPFAPNFLPARMNEEGIHAD